MTADVSPRPLSGEAERGAVVPLVLFAVAVAAELVAVAADWTALQWIAKPLLAPLLIWHVLRRGRADAVVAALCFATAGDIALLIPGETAFLIGMLFFLGTQLSLITAFLRRPRPTTPSQPTRPGSGRVYPSGRGRIGLSTGVYVLLWAVANALLWSQLGPLRLPVLLYSLALTAMAATATRVSRRVAAGGALFLVSDLLIGLGAAGLRAPAHDILVMATYAAALFLIATGRTE